MWILPYGYETNIPEEWFPLLDFHIPNVEPWYYISNYGRVYNQNTGVMYTHNDENKYHKISIYFRDGNSKYMGVHQLVALVYCWDPTDYDNVKREVNHIDGKPGHNWAWNLEWITHRENIIHCIETGLMPLGEERKNVVYSNEEIERICQLISEGKNNPQIRDIMGYPDNKIFGTIQNIKNGHCWTHISCKYDFSKANTKNVFSDEMIHRICKYFEDNGTHVTYKKILKDIGIDWENLSEKELDCLNACICNLRTKVSFSDICNQYNYTHTRINRHKYKS